MLRFDSYTTTAIKLNPKGAAVCSSQAALLSDSSLFPRHTQFTIGEQKNTYSVWHKLLQETLKSLCSILETLVIKYLLLGYRISIHCIFHYQNSHLGKHQNRVHLLLITDLHLHTNPVL